MKKLLLVAMALTATQAKAYDNPFGAVSKKEVKQVTECFKNGGKSCANEKNTFISAAMDVHALNTDDTSNSIVAIRIWRCYKLPPLLVVDSEGVEHIKAANIEECVKVLAEELS